MINTSKPKVQNGIWICGVCATPISKVSMHGGPVDMNEKCPFCERTLDWEQALKKDSKKSKRNGW